MVESGLPDWTAGTVLASPHAHNGPLPLQWPLGMDASAPATREWQLVRRSTVNPKCHIPHLRHLRHMPHLPHAQRGMALIEALVASAILGIVLLGATQLTLKSLHLARENRQHIEAQTPRARGHGLPSTA